MAVTSGFGPEDEGSNPSSRANIKWEPAQSDKGFEYEQAAIVVPDRCPRCKVREASEPYGPCVVCRGKLRNMKQPEKDNRFGRGEAVKYGDDYTRPVPKGEG